MKAKKMITACALLIAAACPTQAQTSAQATDTDTLRHARVSTQGDSIIIHRGKGDLRIRIYEKQEQPGNPDEQKEVELFEGVYLEKVDADKRTFFDALPFIPKKKKQLYIYDPHCSGVFIGYSRITDNFLSFSTSDRMALDLSKSWEFGFNLLSVCHNFKKNPHWGINAGLNWGYRSFSIDGNHALLKGEDGNTFTAGDEETRYSKSRLRHFFFRVPLLVEWQQKMGYSKVFFNAGPEFEIRHGVKSFSHINGGKKQTVGKGMYVHPVGINLLAQAGYGNIGIYLRYSTYGLFQKGKGPDTTPYPFGVAGYW